MKFHYGGKYRTEDDLKAEKTMHEGAIPFREPNQKKFAIIANGGCLVVLALLLVICFSLAGVGFREFSRVMGVGCVISMIILIPHEFLHASCFKEDVYLYHDFSKLLLFVHGTESMSKARFVFMSLLPNIVFGAIPFILFLINPGWLVLGTFGAFSLAAGFGDYINVFNALTQMPKGAKTFLYGFHSYWYKGDR